MPEEKLQNTKKLGRGNNLLMQDKNAIFHEKVKNLKNILFLHTSFFLISKNTINGPNLS